MEDILERIARTLLLHGSFTKDLGLLTGKMGISIFSFLYSRYSRKSIYENFAGDLIDEIYEDIHIGYSKNFDKGLAGIAWGIEFLIQNRFVNANADDILKDIDSQLIERDVRKITDDSLNSGLKGIAHYIISRCGNKTTENPILKTEYIVDLVQSMQNICPPDDTESHILTDILTDIVSGKRQYFCSDRLLKQITLSTDWNTQRLFLDYHPLGIIHNGYTGIGLKILLNAKS